MCILSEKQVETELIGNTTGHVDDGKANCCDPERTSPVHQIWARDLSSGAPGGGALLGEQGCTREGAGSCAKRAARGGAHGARGSRPAWPA